MDQWDQKVNQVLRYSEIILFIRKIQHETQLYFSNVIRARIVLSL